MPVTRSVTGDRDLLAAVWPTLWQRLPLVTAMNVLSCLALAPAVLAFGAGLWPVAALLLVALGGPAVAACVAVADDLVRHGEQSTTSLGSLLRAVGRAAGAGMTVLVVPAAIGTLTLATAAAWRAAPAQSWLLAPLALDCVALALAALGTIPALSLRGTGGVRGRRMWRASLGAVAAMPLPATGLVALVVLGWLLADAVGGGVWFLLPGPITLLGSAITWSAVARVAPAPTSESTSDSTPGSASGGQSHR